MKKLCCLILSFCIVFLLAGCGGKKSDNKNTVDLEYYARLGKMPEVEFSLGSNADDITKKLNEQLQQENINHKEDPNHDHSHDESEFFFEVIEGQNNVLLDNGTVRYYYKKANKDKGISYIVNYDTAYGFTLGTVISQVKDAFPKIEFTEEPLDSNNAFFADYVINGTVLRTSFEKTTVLFVFQDNELFATAIYNSNWS